MSGNMPRKLGSKLGSLQFVYALTCGVGVVPVACSEVRPNELEASTTAALIGGLLSPVERDAVVFIRANHPDGVFDDCTGTLVSPHVVITAKHCVTLVQSGEFVCTGAGALVENGQGAGLFGAKVEAAQIDIYPGTAPVGATAAHALEIYATESGDACHDDVAALVLDTPIQQDYYPSLRVARPTVVGENVRLVGYGTVGHDTLIERRELADVRVLDVGNDAGIQNPKATTPSRSFVVGGGTACYGDSGGPALSMETGALMGVYSRITGDCFSAESRNTFMLASSFMELFTQAFEQAGEQPQLEPALETIPTDSGGAAGASFVLAGAAGSGGVAEPTEPSRHEALSCSFGRSSGHELPAFAEWIALVWMVGFSRRRFARSPFSAG